jgi:hypothetical protein
MGALWLVGDGIRGGGVDFLGGCGLQVWGGIESLIP